jgi:myo-inositol-1(or 4)-monophosphatase
VNAVPTTTATQRRADCERIALEAGGLLRSRFGDPGIVRGKGAVGDRYDVVTEVDVLAEQLVLRGIDAIAPDALVLAEEGGVTSPRGARVAATVLDADELWIVDPLDGTINFAHDIPHFAVSVACWRAGEPVAGAIVDPMVGELFSFERTSDTERAAFLDGRELHLSPTVTASDSLVYLGSSAARMPELVANVRGCRQVASAALALAWTGAGRCGAYVQLGRLRPWDWAVGAPFVQAAGGMVTDPASGTWPPALDGATGILAAAPTVHADLVNLLAPR